MKGSIVVSLLFALTGVAAAEESNGGLDLDQNPLETPWTKPLRTKKWVDDVPSYNGFEEVQAAAGFSNVIYLNNCKGGGCALTRGQENSLANKSSILGSNSATVSPFAYSDSVWQQVVDCVKQTYSPFGVQIVTTRPTSGNYHMAIVAGVPQNIGEPQGVGGVSPFACGYLPNAISFSFANVYGGDVNDICWTVAQETAHSWGLDHKFDNRDPMTYLQSGPGRKNFMNEPGSCGEFSARQCDCQYTGGKLNSFAEVFDTFGGNTPTPPTIQITAPMANATGLPQGFPIQAQIEDDVGVAKVELRIDNQLVDTKEAKPFAWVAPASLGQGSHQIELTAYDFSGTSAKQMVMATLGNSCTGDSECPSGNVCLQGRCVLGGGSQGGLGTTCEGNANCSSGQCAGDGAGTQLCVEACDPALDGCPSGFECLGDTGAAVCWPATSEGICNVGTNGSGKAAPTFLLLGIAALWITRRRRK